MCITTQAPCGRATKLSPRIKKIPLEVIYFPTVLPFSRAFYIDFPAPRTALFSQSDDQPTINGSCPETNCGCVSTFGRSGCFVQMGGGGLNRPAPSPSGPHVKCSAAQLGDMTRVRQSQTASCSALPGVVTWLGPDSLINPGLFNFHWTTYIYPCIYPHPERLLCSYIRFLLSYYCRCYSYCY